MGLRNFKLFSIYWILILEMNLVLPEVIFVQANGLLVLEQDVDVPFSEFFRNLQVATSCDIVSGQFGPGSVWDIAFDGHTDFGGRFVHEWVKLVILIRSTVFDDNFAVFVFVNAD
jgi:hypothetical protein